MNDLERLSYCSRARGGGRYNVPPDLASIVIQGRRFNQSNGITGQLSFRQGSYLQILEGPSPIVENLFESICRDPRHTEVSLLIRELNIPDRLFEGKHFQLASSKETDPTVVQYLERHTDDLRKLDRETLAVLKPFFRVTKTASSVMRIHFRSRAMPKPTNSA